MADIKREKAADKDVLVLGGELTVTHISSVKNELQDVLRSSSSVQVRMENVQDLDVAFLQLLCAAHRTAADENKSLTIGGDMEKFRALLKRSGFQRHIGCRENSRYPCLWLCEKEES